MNEIQIFDNPRFGRIRTYIEPDGTVLFCGSDTTKALGYSNTRDALSRHCKGVVKRDTLTEGGEQQLNFIPEGDVYRLAAKSALPEADEFERWIFDEVLPSIRKHGAFITPDKIDEILSDPDMIIRLATILKSEREKNRALETENAQQKQMLSEYRPKASYYDVVLQTKDVLSIGKIAKDYGKSAQWLNEYLHDKGIQYKQGRIWLLYQKYAEQGYTKSKTHTYIDEKGERHSSLHTYWTQKGRLFIYDTLKGDGLLPLIEQKSAG